MSIHASFISIVTNFTRPGRPSTRRSPFVDLGLGNGSRVRVSG